MITIRWSNSILCAHHSAYTTFCLYADENRMMCMGYRAVEPRSGATTKPAAPLEQTAHVTALQAVNETPVCWLASQPWRRQATADRPCGTNDPACAVRLHACGCVQLSGQRGSVTPRCP